MARKARVDPIPGEVLEDAASEFLRAALKALEGCSVRQKELADRLGWADSTLSYALKGHFTFNTWPKICRALETDPIDELVRGRDELRREQDREREDAYRRMQERAEADTMVEFYRTLTMEERDRVARRLAEVDAEL